MRKSLFSKAILPAILFLSFFSIIMTSCEVGMGESVDLEAPYLKIESHKNGEYAPRHITLSGTATDNRRLYSVEVKYSYSVKENGAVVKKTGSKNASLSGSNWSATFDFDGDYEVEFEAYAYDSRKNGSDESHDRVMVLIDAVVPTINKMSILRGHNSTSDYSYAARLLPLADLQAKATSSQINEPQNKDYFQNESFKINSNLKDNYGIAEAKIELHSGSKTGPVVYEALADESNNKFAPEFTITKEKLSSLPQNQITYLYPVLKVKDEAGNPQIRDDDGVLAWYPDYNKPHVKYTTKIGNLITVPENNSIPVTVFDDDDINTIKYALVKQSDYATAAAAKSATLNKSVTVASSGERDKSFDVQLENSHTDGMYWLVVEVTDKGSIATDKYLEATAVKITNADVPVIIVQTPNSENQEPSLSAAGDFTISGYVSDNQSVDKIAIAWLINGTNSEKAATTFFENYDFAGTAAGGAAASKTTSDLKVWKLTSGTFTDGKNTFTKTFNYYTDLNGQTKNENKIFMIAAKDKSDHLTLKLFRMSQITSSPSFEIKYQQEGESTWTSLTDPFKSFTDVKTTTFQITPQTENGAPPVTECKATNADTNAVTNWSDGKVVISLTNPQSGAIFNYKLYAKDKVGNTASQNLTIMFDKLGKLEKIECTKIGKNTFTAGETIKLQADFSGSVKFENINTTNKPYIQLSASGTAFRKHNGNGNYKNLDADKRRAYIDMASGATTVEGSTIYFSYTVPDDEEIEASKITIVKSDGSTAIGTTDPIVRPSGVRFTGEIDNTWTNTIDSKEYNIDTVQPYITGITPANGGVVEKNADGSVDIVVTFNENVWVESGTIIMQRTPGWYIPPVITEKVFLKIYNDPKAKTNISGAGGNAQTVLCSNMATQSADTLLPKGPYMQYTNGLKVSGTKLVPDLTTKYVLDYQYNIQDTTGVVQNLRTVLEYFDYHKATIDASGNSVTASVGETIKTNKVTINVKDGDFTDRIVNGVEYFMTITPETVRDASYNYYKQGKTANDTNNKVEYSGVSDYKFWVGPVATPVIRVNRVATNATDADPQSTTPDSTTGAGAAKTKAKIDCETPGATITYNIHAKTGDGIFTRTQNVPTYQKLDDETTSTVDGKLTASDKKTITPNGSAELDQDIGDGKITTCQKIYIPAKATKSGMKDSAVGREGAFKTMLCYEYGSNREWLKIFGAQVAESSSSTAGWPLTQNEDTSRYGYQFAYKKTTSDTVKVDNNDTTVWSFYWVSWQILSDFTLQTHNTSNFQNPADPNCTYGMYIFCHRKANY